MRLIALLLAYVISGSLWAQSAEFNPLKELQTIPDAARITVTADKLVLFNTIRRITLLIDGVRVADGDSDNPATIETEPGKEFIFEVCAINRNAEIFGNCVFGGVMRPTNNTLYRLNFKFNQGLNYLVFLGKQSF